VTATNHDPIVPPGYPAAARWLDRLAVFWLFVFAAFAPHSIAVTQGAWLFAVLFAVLRCFVRPRLSLPRAPIVLPLLVFFGLSVVSSLFSYERAVSIGKLRAAGLFTIVFVVGFVVRSSKVRCALALMLVASSGVGVIHTVVGRALGRGVQVEQVAANSPLRRGLFRAESGQTAPQAIESGDTILELNGAKVTDPQQVVDALANSAGPIKIHIYHLEATPVLEFAPGGLLSGSTATEKLGVGSWRRARDWRASGFFGHYVTYSESLQLIASLAFGLIIALWPLKSKGMFALAAVFGGLCVCLLLTATRASELGLLISAFVIVVAGASRKGLLVLTHCAIPVIAAGLLVVQQYRQVGFVDTSDGSTQWRQKVWREGAELLVRKPRHLLVGVGMDSIKFHRREWGLFDGGRLPVGHMHNTPLQLALERGIPVLLVWLWLLVAYVRWLWLRLRHLDKSSWCERGILLGALGGAVGFFVAGFLHYNLGDSEVAEIFYFIMGLALISPGSEKPSLGVAC
jgi:O-antigen ligase